ncbi:hypothetical protein DXB19_04225 [Lachnospiraceae bacterium OM02-26]|nr:hypothetical protein DXB19_04225 [Lachnospiraceae bacterium OM02-26]
MIITKKEFKDAVRKVIIEAVKETRDPNFTEEENKVADKNIATGMTDFYSKLIAKLYGQDNEEWIYNMEEAFDNANTILNERMANNNAAETVFENLAYAASVVRLLRMLEENEQEETVPKEFDVEEILKEAGSEQE